MNKITEIKQKLSHQIEYLGYEHKNIRTLEALSMIVENLHRIDIDKLEKLTEDF